MTSASVFRPLIGLAERFRPAFFSQQEWWFHLVMGSILLPLGNYFNFGPHYLSNSTVFLLGTVCGTLQYIGSIIVLTLLYRRIIAYYPNYQQTVQRTLVMILAIGTGAVLFNIVEFYFFSLIPIFGISFSWQTLSPMLALNAAFVSIFCVAISLIYGYNHWKREQIELEGLKSQVIQQKLDALKQQVNPHFLFNSLSSISALVGEDPAQAERLVDNLSKVYRYMLQANNREQVPLQDELAFIKIYADVLKVRFGESLRIELPPVDSTVFQSESLPPLSLQILIDNAIKHNRMAPGQPLVIKLFITKDVGLVVTNTLQRKTRIIDLSPNNLAYLISRYSLLTPKPIQVVEDDKGFSVTLPLLVTENYSDKTIR